MQKATIYFFQNNIKLHQTTQFW